MLEFQKTQTQQELAKFEKIGTGERAILKITLGGQTRLEYFSNISSLYFNDGGNELGSVKIDYKGGEHSFLHCSKLSYRHLEKVFTYWAEKNAEPPKSSEEVLETVKGIVQDEITAQAKATNEAITELKLMAEQTTSAFSAISEFFEEINDKK